MKKQQANKIGSSEIFPFASTMSIFITIGFILLTTSTFTEGGCSRFGHSCFGAHGKRGHAVEISGNPNMGRISGTADESFQPILPFSGTGVINDYERIEPIEGHLRKISPYLREWIMNGGSGLRRVGDTAGEEVHSREYVPGIVTERRK